MSTDRPSGGPPGEGFGTRMTPTDARLINECRSEAFWSRGLPLMLGLSTATHLLVKMNKLSPHPRYGSFFKVCWAAFFGNIFGKISYQTQCNEKLKADPNSILGRTIRRGKGEPLLTPTDPATIEIINKYENDNASSGAVSGGQAGAPATGYDEMRRRNRMGLPPVTPPPPGGAEGDAGLTPIGEPEADEIPAEERPMNRRMPIPKRNKYGDVVEDD